MRMPLFARVVRTKLTGVWKNGHSPYIYRMKSSGPPFHSSASETRYPRAVPGGEEDPILRPGEDPRDGARRSESFGLSTLVGGQLPTIGSEISYTGVASEKNRRKSS